MKKYAKKCVFVIQFLVLSVNSKALNHPNSKGNDSRSISVPENHKHILSEEQSKAEKVIMQKVQALLKKMTVEEKVGQMTQLTLDVITDKKDPSAPEKILNLNSEKLKEAILKYHVGSILNVADDRAASVDHWHDIITGIQNEAQKDRLKIPVLYGIDSIHGAHYTQGATIFPQSINMAATWRPEYSMKLGAITALETRASGIPWNFFPVLDIGRQYLWSRFFETYGEDVYLATEMGRANVIGQQGDNIGDKRHVAITMKHYLGYSYPTSGKDKTPAMISERMMREYFLPTFAAAVKAGAETAMINTAEIDGIPGHANYHLLTEVLKQELGFKGFTVSDWLDIKKLHERDHVASTMEEAVKMAVIAGIDMSMVPYDYSFSEVLTKLVKTKQVPMSRIDDAVGRILRVKYLLGLFENPFPDKTLKSSFATDESIKLSEKMAAESVVLVKNDKNILPLDKRTKIFVTGPTANSMVSLNGGWTISWQGNDENLYPKNKKTVFTALKDAFGKSNVTYFKGVTYNNKSDDYESALEEASNADVIFLCLGEKAYTEVPGNIDDLNLDSAQVQYAQELYKIGKPVVLLMLQGRPRIISAIEGGASAILVGMLPGMEGGKAISDIVVGRVNPSGHLPFSYPRYSNDLLNYDHKYQESSEEKKFNPQWPFGFGLSYTTFSYTDLQISKKEINEKESLKVSVVVTNTGNREGEDVVQLYLSDVYRYSVTPPVKQLKAFQKIILAPNESKKVEFILRLNDFSFIGKDNKRVAEKGLFKIQIDNLETQFELK